MLISRERAVDLNRDMKEYVMRPVRLRVLLLLSERRRTVPDMATQLGWSRQDLARQVQALITARFVAIVPSLAGDESYKLTDLGLAMSVVLAGTMGDDAPVYLFCNGVRARMKPGWEYAT